MLRRRRVTFDVAIDVARERSPTFVNVIGVVAWLTIVSVLSYAVYSMMPTPVGALECLDVGNWTYASVLDDVHDRLRAYYVANPVRPVPACRMEPPDDIYNELLANTDIGHRMGPGQLTYSAGTFVPGPVAYVHCDIDVTNTMSSTVTSIEVVEERMAAYKAKRDARPPLHRALESGASETATIADKTLVDDNGCTPLHYWTPPASDDDARAVLAEMLRLGVDINAVNEYVILDLPARVYETGGGYTWRKKPGVTIRPTDFLLEPVERDERSASW